MKGKKAEGWHAYQGWFGPRSLFHMCKQRVAISCLKVVSIESSGIKYRVRYDVEGIWSWIGSICGIRISNALAARAHVMEVINSRARVFLPQLGLAVSRETGSSLHGKFPQPRATHPAHTAASRLKHRRAPCTIAGLKRCGLYYAYAQGHSSSSCCHACPQTPIFSPSENSCII